MRSGLRILLGRSEIASTVTRHVPITGSPAGRVLCGFRSAALEHDRDGAGDATGLEVSRVGLGACSSVGPALCTSRLETMVAGLHDEMACAVPVARGSAADGSLGIAALTKMDLVDAGDRSLKFAEEGLETGGRRSWPRL